MSDDAQEIVAVDPLLRRLAEVIECVALTATVEEVVETTLCAARDLTGANGAAFVLGEGHRCWEVSAGRNCPIRESGGFPLNLCVCSWLALNRSFAVVDDVQTDLGIPTDVVRPPYMKGLVTTPVRVPGTFCGMNVYWDTDVPSADNAPAILRGLAGAVSMAIEKLDLCGRLEQRIRERTRQLEAANERLASEVRKRKRAEAKLSGLSITDELTGLHNRRGFSLLAEQGLRAARRERTGCALIFIDVDGLKAVNDTLGHREGDAMLVDVAAVLRSTFREADVIARIGGDEFAVLTTGLCDGSGPIKARLQGCLRDLNRRGDRCYQLSLSMGVAAITPETLTAVSLEDLLARADRAMYADKRRKTKGADFLAGLRSHLPRRIP